MCQHGNNRRNMSNITTDESTTIVEITKENKPLFLSLSSGGKKVTVKCLLFSPRILFTLKFFPDPHWGNHDNYCVVRVVVVLFRGPLFYPCYHDHILLVCVIRPLIYCITLHSLVSCLIYETELMLDNIPQVARAFLFPISGGCTSTVELHREFKNWSSSRVYTQNHVFLGW